MMSGKSILVFCSLGANLIPNSNHYGHAIM